MHEYSRKAFARREESEFAELAPGRELYCDLGIANRVDIIISNLQSAMQRDPGSIDAKFELAKLVEVGRQLLFYVEKEE